VTEPFDFTAAVRVALREYAPDLVVLLGPGIPSARSSRRSSSRRAGRGFRSREDFMKRQETDPIRRGDALAGAAPVGRVSDRALLEEAIA
jgi:hypothetical protein